MRKSMWVSLLAVLLVLSGLLSYHAFATTRSTKKYHYSDIPTLYLHGYGGGRSSADNMIAAAEKSGAAKKVLTATVSKSGKVKLTGHWQTGKVNPLVQVLFENNRNPNFTEDGQWLKNVVVALQQRYHIKQFNVVAHSMGNMALMHYILDNGQNDQLPKLQKQVDLAGHFAGIIGMDDKPNQNHLLANGRPAIINKSYQDLLDKRDQYPNQQISVMNIYGNLEDGTNSDERVSNVSSRSLKYLLGDRPKHYEEHMIKGPDGQHSKLHNNAQVDKLVINFLWGNQH
ncbi:alpha/beta hydrolase [Furfurilactobacillus siliginis]|uniref:Alpha/beta hydrolase n=1 Tax=Furfurilactobacillus siliginis TaxID=348151 RepID=A0A0R2L741_9LACO|nr:alpha/beta hydrolase [Furfurilactobacillus siliginis]KRN97216.1 hypothetical protein IV55_GL000140 [Furfurilactobacillus siliginis]GEK29133.1 alpha/beta hydrolase [Furfurilactobacillus siliginis]